MMVGVDGELALFSGSNTPAEAVEDAKLAIDAMTYEDALRKVIVAPLTDPMFRGEIGRYFHAALKQKRHDTPPEERAAAAERISASTRK